MTPSDPPVTAPARSGQRSAHILALDGLRGLAILAVIPYNSDLFGGHGAAKALTFAAGAGWIGVQLFFVLSGFLITGNLIESRGAANYYRAFYARRTLRIFPLYYATLAVLFWVLPAIGRPLITHTEHQIWFWVYLCNWSDPIGLATPGLGHFWSLAIEEQFYLIWPWLVVVSFPRLGRLCLVLAATALVCRVGLLALGGTAEMVYHFTFCRMDALVVGAAAAVVFSQEGGLPSRWRTPPRLFWTGITLVALGALVTDAYRRTNLGSITVGFSVLSVAFGLIVLAAALPGESWWRRALEFGPLRSAGKYSYAMYVFHMLIIGMTRDHASEWLGWTGVTRPIAYMVLVAILSYVAAFVSFHVFEKHFLGLKKYFLARQVEHSTS